MNLQLTLRTLGDLVVLLDGEPVTGFPTRKVEALLVYLAVERGTTHRRETLFTLLWPGMPESSARNNLRQVLYYLRKTIPRVASSLGTDPVPLLVSDRYTVKINPDADLEVDLHQMDYLLDQVQYHGHLSLTDCQNCIKGLEQAADLYRGEFLAGFYLDDSNLFEDWAVTNREAYRRKALEALATLAEIHLQNTDYPQAQSLAEKQLEIDPLREDAYRQLMEALARGGHRARALRQYRVCLQILEDELGIVPSQETTALYERIRMETLDVSALTPTPCLKPPLGTPFPSVTEPTWVETPIKFFGRERELDRLGDTLARSQVGQLQVVFITGDPGRGKTALMAAFAQKAMEAYPNLLVAQGNCNAFSGVSDPYLPFREVLSQLTGDVKGQYSIAPISSQQAQRLWATAPTTMQRLVDHGPYLVERLVASGGLLDRAQTLSPEESGWLNTFRASIERAQTLSGDLPQAALFEQYANLLRSLACESPLLLLLDDLQWADRGSLHLLAHLGQRLGNARVCLVGAYRPEEVSLLRDGERHPLIPILHDIKRRFGEVEIDLQESDDQTSQAFMDALLDSEPNRLGPAFRERFFERTQGHPLFTVELLRALQSRGDLVWDPQSGWVAGQQLDCERLPARIEAVIAERVDRLDERLRGILAVASVEGEVFTAQVVAQVDGLPDRGLFQAFSQELGTQHQLVRETGEVQVGGQYLARYRFVHALFQEYFYQGLGAGERRLLHSEVAAALEALYADQTDRVLAELAHHYATGGWIEKAITYLHKAGQAAAASYANEEAVRYFSKALELVLENDTVTHFNLLESRVKVLDILGNRDTQCSDIELMAVLVEGLDETAQARVALRQAHYAFVISDYAQEIKHAQVALELAQKEGEWGLAAEAHNCWGQALFGQGKYLAAQAHFQTGLQLAQAEGDQQQVADCLHSLGSVYFYHGNYSQAQAYHKQALAIHQQIGNRQGEGKGLIQLGYLALSQGDLAAARVNFKQALRIRKKIGDRRGEGWSLMNLGNVVWYQGDYAMGKLHLEQSIAIFRETSDRQAEGWSLGYLGLIAFYQGDDAAARGYNEQFLAIEREIGNRDGEGTSLRQLGVVVWHQGDEAAAKAYLEGSLAIFREIGSRWGEGMSWNELGAVALAQADLSLAESCYQQALVIRQEINQPQYLVEDWVGLAKVKLAQGDPENARCYAELILEYLRGNPRLDFSEHPMRVFRFAWEVWVALDENSAADNVLALAAAIIQDYLDKNSDPDVQAMYLQQPNHAVLWAAWQEKTAD
jgi:adenylate cyclase